METLKILSVCSNKKGGIPKYPRKLVHVGKYGIEGDFHSGRTNNHAKKSNPNRQISLISSSVIEELRVKLQVELPPGSFGENFLIQGLGDLSSINTGVRLMLGEEVIIEITKQNTPCITLNEIHPLMMTSILGRRGLVAKVERTGKVRPEDLIKIL